MRGHLLLLMTNDDGSALAFSLGAFFFLLFQDCFTAPRRDAKMHQGPLSAQWVGNISSQLTYGRHRHLRYIGACAMQIEARTPPEVSKTLLQSLDLYGTACTTCELEYGKPINCANTNSVISLWEESYYICGANILLQEENWTQKVENYFFTAVSVVTVGRNLFLGELMGSFVPIHPFRSFRLQGKKNIIKLIKIKTLPTPSP